MVGATVGRVGTGADMGQAEIKPSKQKIEAKGAERVSCG